MPKLIAVEYTKVVQVIKHQTQKALSQLSSSFLGGPKNLLFPLCPMGSTDFDTIAKFCVFETQCYDLNFVTTFIVFSHKKHDRALKDTHYLIFKAI